jgi:hypothetical protein
VVIADLDCGLFEQCSRPVWSVPTAEQSENHLEPSDAGDFRLSRRLERSFELSACLRFAVGEC